jgi:hypothetical protein
MLEIFFSSILLAQSNYIYLTPTNKVAVEKRIAEKGFASHPQINPSEISSILNLQPHVVEFLPILRFNALGKKEIDK